MLGTVLFILALVASSLLTAASASLVHVTLQR
jgi:hypothetical protein